jgi:hypothetical protein
MDTIEQDCLMPSVEQQCSMLLTLNRTGVLPPERVADCRARLAEQGFTDYPRTRLWSAR